MTEFHRRELDVLVATSVVEVGIDVPNAKLMTIEGGERFGLAQLHQLRGRVSRGAHPGYVCVFATPGSEDANERLDAFCSTTDGFEIAEHDLRTRGPGDLFSFRQHGMPPLRIADLARDTELLQEARADARAILTVSPTLDSSAYRLLRARVLARYGKVMELGDVG